MKENFQHPNPSSEKPVGKEVVPKFIKDFSREKSPEERDAVAAAIWERRRERDAWRAEQNSRLEKRNNLKAEIEALNEEIRRYGSDGFLHKIKDYFAYRKIKAQISEKAGQLEDFQFDLDQGDSEKPEFKEAKELLENFYQGEKEKWARADYTAEDIKKNFSEENLSKLSLEDYALLMKRFPGEMLTHVTRQGIRDHASSFWHTLGTGSFSNGFKSMLEDGRLRSSLGIALQEHNKEGAMARFLHLDGLKSREEALAMYRSKFEQNLASSDAFADSAAVHFASENVMDDMYGSERGNEIFITFPSAYIAAQFYYGGKGTLADRGKSQHNDKWVYTKDHEGMPLDAGIVFIPEDAQVDLLTGSRYKIDDQGEPIIPRERIEEILAARFDNKGFFQTFIQKLPRLDHATSEAKEKSAEEAFREFGITDPEAKKALLDSDLLRELASLWGQDAERGEYEKILIKYFLKNAENPYELSETRISSREYWEKYFQENPDKKPSKVVYYSGGDPSRALDEWREKNGIIKRTQDATYGFAERKVAGNSAQANIGRDRFSSLAVKVINDRFPDSLPSEELNKDNPTRKNI